LAVETDLGSLKHNFLEARSYYILHIRSEIDLLFLLRDHHGPVTIIPNRLPGIVVVLGWWLAHLTPELEICSWRVTVSLDDSLLICLTIGSFGLFWIRRGTFWTSLAEAMLFLNTRWYFSTTSFNHVSLVIYLAL